jgi:hypothetical protein
VIGGGTNADHHRRGLLKIQRDLARHRQLGHVLRGERRRPARRAFQRPSSSQIGMSRSPRIAMQFGHRGRHGVAFDISAIDLGR